MVNDDRDAALRYTFEAEKIGEETDDILHIARKNLVVVEGSIRTLALTVMLRGFIEALENVTDYAEDVADYSETNDLK